MTLIYVSAQVSVKDQHSPLVYYYFLCLFLLQDFQFQQLCKVRVSDSPGNIPANRVQLIVSSSKFGLTFVGIEKGKSKIEMLLN